MTTPVDAEIARLEHALGADDPGFVRHCRRLVRRDAARCAVVLVLLAVTAGLFALGLLVEAPAPWAAGLVTFALAFLADVVLADR